MEINDREPLEAAELRDEQPNLDLNNIDTKSDEEILQTDSRGYSMLMVAAETGNTAAVDKLISRYVDLEFEHDGRTAASLAFQAGHYGIVLKLLKANAKFPRNYDNAVASNDLKAFVELSTNMHARVRTSNDENLETTKEFLKNIIDENPNLRHFYNMRNSSLLRTAIVNKMFAIYEFLLTLNIFLGIHEDMTLLTRRFRVGEHKRLREINLKLSSDVITEPMMILLRNCKFGPDNLKNRDYLDFVRKAFEFLFKIPPIAIILKVVAAARDFKIIFDFKRDSVTFLDSSAEPYTNGLFYLNGKIYIAAKDMFDPQKLHDVYSVIAHELCHFAMFLVYGNYARPYQEKSVVENDFILISQECERLKNSQELIRLVYDEYEVSQQHAELIVRIPQMIVALFNDPQFLTQMRGIFAILFDFYETNVVTEMERALPGLQEKYRPNREIEEKVKKQKIFIILLGCFLIFGLPVVAYYFHSPTYKYSDLSDAQKINFQNAKVNFHGVDVKFNQLFSNDSAIYDFLSSDQIKYGLEGKIEDLSNAVDTFYSHQIFLTWSNMTEKIKNTFESLDVNFQGQKVALNKILTNFDVLNSLTSIEVQKSFMDIPLNISRPTEVGTKFFINRFVVDEDVDVENNENGQSDVKNIERIFCELNDSKIFLLSNFAGEGKSTTFRNMAMRLKTQFNSKWIQFVDLKKHSEAYKKGSKIDLSDPEQLLEFLTLNLLKLNKLESEIFRELFKIGHVIFFWDGIDEISPLYKDFMLTLTSTLKSDSKCLQLISTRPQYSKDFQEKLNIKAHKLIPLGKSQRFELLVKFIVTENFKLNAENFWEENFVKKNFSNETGKIFESIEKGRKILLSIEGSNPKTRLLSNPLLLRMIAEISSDESLEDSISNVYKIFDIFMDKKLNILRRKGQIIEQELNKITKSTTLNVMQVHEAYALKRIFFGDSVEIYLNEKGFTLESFEIVKSMKKLSPVEITRFGIINVNSQDDFTFAHQTFAEFLVAKFLIEHIDEIDVESNEKDAKIKLYLLNSVLFSGKFEVVRKFLMDYAMAEENIPKILEMVKESKKIKNLTENEKIYQFFTFKKLQNFFKKNHEINLEDFLTADPFPLASKELQEIEEKLEDFKNILGPDFFPAMLTRDFKGQTLFLSVGRDAVEVFYNFFEKLKKILTKEEVIQIILKPTLYNATCLMFIAHYQDFKVISTFWKFIDENLKMNEKKIFLKMEFKSTFTAFHYGLLNKDPKSFLFFKDVHEKLFTRDEIRETLTKVNEIYLPFVCNVIVFASYETAIEVSNYLEKLFENHKIDMRKILSSRNEVGESIFSYLREKESFEDKLKIFVEFLRRNFKDNQDEEYEKFLYHFKKITKTFEVLSKVSDDITFRDVQSLRSFEWFDDDFQLLLEFHEKLGENNLYYLLTTKNTNTASNLIHDVMSNSYEEKIVKFLNFSTEKLLKTEVISLLMAQDNSTNNPMMMAVKYQPITVVEYFWEFLKNYLTQNELEKILKMENKNFETILQHSIEDEKVFNFMMAIYEKFLTNSEIKLILMKSKTFLINLVRFASFETSQAVAKFIERIFNDKEDLRKFLTLELQKGETIFNLPKTKKENQKVFEELLKKCFNNLRDFQNYLINLQIPRKFKNPELSRSESWDSNDFEYFIKNCHEMKTFSKFLKSQDTNGTSLIHELILNGDEKFYDGFLKCLQLTLTKNEVINLLLMKNNENQNAMMMVVKLWTFENVKKFLENFKDLKNLLKTEDNNLWTTLQHSALNHDEKSFEFILKIYEENLNQKEIKEIILKHKKESLPFVYDVIKQSSEKTSKEVLKFLENLLKSDLKEFLNTKNSKGATISKKSKKSSKNFKIFEPFFKIDSEENEIISPQWFSKFLEKNSTSEVFIRKKFTMELFLDLYNNLEKNQNDKNLKKILMSKTFENKTLLHDLIVVNDGNFDEPILLKIDQILNKSEILNLVFVIENNNHETSLMTQAQGKKLKQFKSFWQILNKNLNQKETKKILLMEQKSYLTALHYSMFNKDSSTFLFIRGIYEKIFSLEKIREILSKTHEDENSFIKRVIKDASSQTAHEVSKYLENLFKNEKIELRRILSKKDKKGDSIFKSMNKKEEFEENPEIFLTLLRKTFDEGQEKEYETFLRSVD